MELMIGIIAFVVIMVGIVTFGEGGYHWLSSINEAATMAWSQSISPSSSGFGSSEQTFIRTWNNTSGSSAMLQGLGLGYLPGTSTSVLQYNFQDTQMIGSSATFNSIAQQMLNLPFAGNPYIAYLDYPAKKPFLTSQQVFAPALQQSGTSGWLIGESTHIFKLGQIDRGYGTPVDFGTALQSLVYGRSSIDMQSQVFLPPLTGLQ